MKKAFALSLICSQMILAACSNNPNAPLVQPQVKAEQISNKGDVLVSVENPKAEIVFVIDNSASMKKHIDNVSANIDRFVDEFSRKSSLEFHVAVTSVYDERRFSKAKYQSKYKDTELYRTKGEFYASGEQHFLSSTDANLKQKLKSLLKVGVQDLENGGPEVEEVLSPLMSIYDPKSVDPTHKGFSMGPNSYKIFFLVTDASDNSLFDISEAYYKLVANAANGQRERLMAFGAIIPENSNNCQRDPGVENNRIAEFLKLAKPSYSSTNNVVSLCGNFGEKFAQFGEMIRKQTQNLKIPLSQDPDFASPDSDDESKGIFVYYGNQRLLLKNGDYKYYKRTIYISETAVKNFAPGQSFSVKYTPISDYDRKYNKVVTLQ